MKLSRTSIASLIAVLGFTVANGYSKLALADDGSAQVSAPAGNEAPARHRHHHHNRRAFSFGVCVGESLAKQNVTLPPRVKGQRPVLTDAEKAALKSAVQSCKTAQS